MAWTVTVRWTLSEIAARDIRRMRAACIDSFGYRKQHAEAVRYIVASGSSEPDWELRKSGTEKQQTPTGSV